MKKGLNQVSRKRNSRLPSLKEVLSVGSDKVDARKLRLLEEKLEQALGCPISEQLVDDPIAIRRKLVETLRVEKIKPGTIQALEQCYMGAIRRAAVKGLIPAPPEGPWTRAWQSVLDLSSEVRNTRAPLRSLAAWATARHVAPAEVSAEQLEAWAKTAMVGESVLAGMRQVLGLWSPDALKTPLVSDALLSSRLMKKAERGTVREGAKSKAMS
jgi:hypothetical protein